ncbi:MAG: DUF4304 domain-containing protein, partial [Chitinophagaceae bacterium]|nr:DUF4304 domain-containing protein [Chitinophagaceae bacterium]
DVLGIIEEILAPINFRKKGNSWIKMRSELSNVVNLQKSKFGDRFYVNYGYIINSLPIEDSLMHIFNGLGSLNEQENFRIQEVLNLENDIPDAERKNEFTIIFKSIVLKSFDGIETEADLVQELRKRPHFNDITLSSSPSVLNK